MPHICALIHSSYDTTIKRPDGKDALALLVTSAIPATKGVWAYGLAEALLDRGADVNTRFNAGQTPLMSWSYGCSSPQDFDLSAGPLLLLQHGADIDARMEDGTTCAHVIAAKGNRGLAATLADAGWLAAADLTLLNNKGETALQIAQRMLASNPHEGNRQMVCDVLRDNAALWTNVGRPLVHQWLSHSLLIPDLAHVVLSFVDGKERSQ
jgi:ankyrin repeat protein